MLLNFTSKHNRFCKNALNPILFLLVLPFSPNFVITNIGISLRRICLAILHLKPLVRMPSCFWLIPVTTMWYMTSFDVFLWVKVGLGSFQLKTGVEIGFQLLPPTRLSMMRMAVWWVSFVFQVIPANWSRYFVGLQLLQGHNQNRLGHLVMVVAATPVA